jgi:hypothetical protein
MGTAAVANLTDASFQLTNTPGDAYSMDVALTPSSVVADGLTSSTATATVGDFYGNPVPGDSISFFDPLPTGFTIGSTTDNGDGTYSATVTPPASTLDGAGQVGAMDTTSPNTPQDTGDLLWTGDGDQPGAAIDSGPKPRTKKRKATFEFSSPAPDLAGFECKFDASGWSDCASPLSYQFKKGRHKFQVRATDLAGNVGEPAVQKFKRV